MMVVIVEAAGVFVNPLPVRDSSYYSPCRLSKQEVGDYSRPIPGMWKRPQRTTQPDHKFAPISFSSMPTSWTYQTGYSQIAV
jgi:hypothetical protein